MPVVKHPDGRRSVHAETEVPGTPEEVWKAIASGPGISAWFVPTTLEENAGGVTTSDFGPGMTSLAHIKEWEPPHRFVAEAPAAGPSEPATATEWQVESKAGGVCVVRVVHSWFASTDDWDKQFEGHTFGWQGFFRILKLYLAHHSGQPCSPFQLMTMAPKSVEETWSRLVDALGIQNASVGDTIHTSGSAPAMTAVAEHVGPKAWPELLLNVTSPCPGTAHMFAMSMGGQALISIRFYLYGASADEAVASEQPKWQQWVDEGLNPALQG